MENSEATKQENRNAYYKLALDNASKIKLIIIGQDPYPTGANGIAFCKDKITDLQGISGEVVINSLGFKLENIQLEFKNSGIELFKSLLVKNGVLFMNFSEEIISKINIPEVIKSASNNKLEFDKLYKPNKTIVLLLGISKKPLYRKIYKEGEVIIHPTKRNQANGKWIEFWSLGKNYLQNILK